MKFSTSTNLLLLASSISFPMLSFGKNKNVAPLDGKKFKHFNMYRLSQNTIKSGIGFDDLITARDERNLGGGFIDGNNMYVVLGAEGETSKLAKIPLTRNASTGKIVDIQFENATMALDEKWLDNGFQETSAAGPDKQLFYSIVPDGGPSPVGYYPYEVHHGTYNKISGTFEARHKITNTQWLGLGINDPNRPSEPFRGLYGIGFSPNSSNKDPGTNHGYMVGTAPYGFWQVGLTGSPSSYTPTVANTKLLCSLPNREYAGGTGFIPSGSLKDSVMLAEYSSGEVQILPLDYSVTQSGTTGLCLDNATSTPTLGTANPKIVTFATGIDEAWGFMFDPQTNDFFVTSYGPGEIHQFEGFPPGVDVQAVIAAIENQVNVIGGAFLASGTRQLRHRELTTMMMMDDVGDDIVSGSSIRTSIGRGNLRTRNLRPKTPKISTTGGSISSSRSKKQETAKVVSSRNEEKSNNSTRKASSGKSKSNESSSSSSSSSSDDEEEEVVGGEIPIDVVVVTSDIEKAITNLNDGAVTDTTELVAAIGKPLATTMANPSYTKDVLNGVNSTAYLANIQAIEVAMKVAVLADDGTGNSTSTSTTTGAFAAQSEPEKVAMRNAVEESNKLLTLLEGAIEGFN